MNISKLLDNLKREGFTVSFFENNDSAVKYLDSQLNKKTIGFGGSKTLEELNLFETLSINNEVYWHWRQPQQEARSNSQTAQVYISSANAIAETGEIINIDGSGNRISSIMYGHEKVYIIVGINKVEETFEKALWRARNIAAPLNAKRLGLKTPCAVSKEMKCYDCSNPDRICCGVSVLIKKMNGIKEMEVILINEQIGY
ncbi:lactate utilization protein [Clostridium butyricum]|uniref:lactate utilization protein n=1 Tax=Clostridium butyricum TaxID=1492 RepID=UPI002ABDBA24|nr:lactate utilization protein [Clostridium butyricum]